MANRGEIAVRVVRACRTPAGQRRRLRRPGPGRAARPAADEAFAWAARPRPRRYLDIDQAPRRRRRSRGGRRPPRLRLPLRERRLRPGRHRRRPDLDRAAPAGHPRARRQGRRPRTSPSAPAPRWSPAPTDPCPAPPRSWRSPSSTACPIAIKAAFGGGGRGMKVVRTLEEIAELFDSAVREAVAAFGRGECFVERYLDRPRHVETQVPGRHARQRRRRRHPRLLPAAPPPEARRGGPRAVPHRRAERRALRTPSKAICREAGYVGAGTVEFLVGRTARSPSSRSTPASRSSTPSPRKPPASTSSPRCSASPTARSPALTDDPALRGHAFEFRHQRRGPRPRLPARAPAPSPASTRPPAPASASTPASSPAASSARQFDSLLAKLIVTGADPRAGPASAPPAPSPKCASRAWPPCCRSTAPSSWTPPSPPTDGAPHPHPLDRNRIRQHHRTVTVPTDTDTDEDAGRETVVVEVERRRLISRPPPRPGTPGRARASPPAPTRGRRAQSESRLRPPRRDPRVADAGHRSSRWPSKRAQVKAGDLVVVLEAMKMENAVHASVDGMVHDLAVKVGDSVAQDALAMFAAAAWFRSSCSVDQLFLSISRSAN